jgi:hypothetical protein
MQRRLCISERVQQPSCDVSLRAESWKRRRDDGSMHGQQGSDLVPYPWRQGGPVQEQPLRFSSRPAHWRLSEDRGRPRHRCSAGTMGRISPASAGSTRTSLVQGHSHNRIPLGRWPALAGPTSADTGPGLVRCPARLVPANHIYFPATSKVHQDGGLVARTPHVLTMHATCRTACVARPTVGPEGGPKGRVDECTTMCWIWERST